MEASDLEIEAQTADPARYHESWKTVCSADGILVPGGFGSRGIEGKIAAIHWARCNKKPFLGICLGLQLAVIGTSRRRLTRMTRVTRVTTLIMEWLTMHVVDRVLP